MTTAQSTDVQTLLRYGLGLSRGPGTADESSARNAAIRLADGSLENRRAGIDGEKVAREWGGPASLFHSRRPPKGPGKKGGAS